MADLLGAVGLDVVIMRYFPAFLAFIVVYAMLDRSKALGENKTINALIGFVVGILFLASSRTSQMLAFMSPWFTVVFLFIIFVVMAFKILGVEDSVIREAANRYNVIWGILTLAILIGLFGVGNVIGQDLLEKQPGFEEGPDAAGQPGVAPSSGQGSQFQSGSSVATDDYNTNVTATIFHPTVLGLMMIGLIGTFATYFLTR